MKIISKCRVFALACVLLAGAATAGETASFLGLKSNGVETNRSAYNDPVVLGRWHSNFKKAKAYAESHKVPFIAVWSNGDKCSHCTKLENALRNSVFKTWMAKSGCVFYFTYNGDKQDKAAGKEGSDVFHWIRAETNVNYPFVRIYWKAGDVDVATIGDVWDGNGDASKASNGSTGAKNAVNYLTNSKTGVIRKYKPAPIEPKYTGGAFEVDDGELEAEIGNTSAVDFQLVRTNATAIAAASTNTVIVTYPSGAATTNVVEWAKNSSATNLTVVIDEALGLDAAGAQVTIVLLDAGGKGVASNSVTMVEEPENSPKNPRWIGERTADTLEWGEWTMDIDAATNKVRAANAEAPGSAYSMMLIGGPLWCPDCINAEEMLFATEAFHEWAVAKKVACIAIDEPPFASKSVQDAPTLLSRDKGAKTVSGAGYISRKMIPMEGNGGTNATDVLARNLYYVNNDTEHGGFCSPDNTDGSGNTGSWKTGVPCVIALRDDGSVAGRLYQFSNDFRDVSRTNTPVTAMLKRLDELLDQVYDEHEDLNDSRRTTQDAIGQRETVEGRTLSFTDGADVYALDPAETFGKRINFTVTATDGVTLQAEVITVAGTGEKVIASVSDSAYPMEIGADVNSSNAFVRVSYPADANGYSYEPQFALSNANSTVFAYTLATDFVVKPTDVAETVTVPDEPTVMVSLVSNQVYRITNLADAAGALEPVAGGTVPDLYTALVTDDVRLTLSAMTASVQKWNPGTVGFAVRSASTAESTGTYVLRLVREGGVSGEAAVTLSKNTVKSSDYGELIGLPADFGEPIVWAEGDGEEKTVEIAIIDNPYADGDQVIYFDAATSGDAETGIDEFKLTLRDNDKKVPGKIAIVSAEPAFAKSMTVFARQGKTVRFEVARINGADGEQKVSLAASAGTLSETGLEWENRTVASRSVVLTLPDSGSSVKVTMTPAKGSSVDSAKRVLTVNMLPGDAPGFLGSSQSAEAVRYVPFGNYYVALDSSSISDWSKVKVAKYSGSLPPGLTWKYVANLQQVVISGVPTKAGAFTAVFRVSEGSKQGLTTAVTIVVTDPVTSGAGATLSEPLNAAVKTSRTFSGMPVYDETETGLIGLLTLTVPRTGKLSAKFVSVDSTKTASFSSKSWKEIDWEDGTLTAELTGKVGSDAATMNVTAAADGGIGVELALGGAREGHDIVVDVPVKLWSKAEPATDFKGYYTVELPVAAKLSGNLLSSGCGYVTLKMDTTSAINAGKFAYAGVLPNGKSFSGSAQLVAKDWLDDPDFLYWSRGVLPILSVAAADTVAGLAEINPGAYDSRAQDYDGTLGVSTGRCYHKLIRRVVRPAAETEGLRWRHVEKAAEACSEAKLGIYGCYYDAKEDFRNCCQQALGTGTLGFFALAGLNDLPEGVLDALAKGGWDEGLTNKITNITVSFAKATKTAKTKTSMVKTSNATKLPLTFTLSTGIVNGTFKLPMDSGSVTFTYRGVVLPGFGNSECSACGIGVREGGVEAAEVPFIAGTAWVNDTLGYTDAAGKARSLTVRRSTPFSAGVNPGE